MEKQTLDNSQGVRKREKRQRPKRKRKRPKSSIHTNDSLKHETYTRRLDLLRDDRLGDPCPLIRIVKPYPFTFSTFAKARWIGRSLLDVYHEEFGSYPRSYYERAIREGKILVSDRKVDPTYTIKGPDVLTHTVHRHEPAVAENITMVKETKELVVVDKPGTLPVHPCGGYHMNCLLNILEPQYGKLFTINRLDRLTSGLVILARSSSTAQELGRCIMARDTCKKVYLARVRGKFPTSCRPDLNLMDNKTITNPPCRFGEKHPSNVTSESTGKSIRSRHCLGYWITDKAGNLKVEASLAQVHESQWDEDDWLRELDTLSPSNAGEHDTKKAREMLWFNLACPTRISVPKDGICEAGSFVDLEDALYEKTVKACETAFGVIRYDKTTDSTIVLCRPMTGRTHQIRLHLQYLGHPIANDPNYGGHLWYGDAKGEEACRFARSELDAMDNATDAEVTKLKGGDDSQEVMVRAKAPHGSTSTDTPATEEEVTAVSLQPRMHGESMEDFVKKTCVWCARSRVGGNDRTMLEFLVRSRGIWLHALQYTLLDLHGQKLSFRTALPSWSRAKAETELN